MTEATAVPPANQLTPSRSIHSVNFPALLRELGVSLVVSTHRPDRLVLMRGDGDRINTHFLPFDRPMGVAVAPGRIAVGDTAEIWEFRDVPAVAQATSSGQVRRLLSGAFDARDRRRPGPRNGLGGQRPLVREHALFLSVYTRRRLQFRAASRRPSSRRWRPMTVAT